MTTLHKVIPAFASETLLRGKFGQPPFLGCGLSSDFIGTMLATLNEAALLPNGTYAGRAWRVNVLSRGWKAFKRVFDSNGIPDRDDYLRIHRAQFPGLPDPVMLSLTKAQAIERLRGMEALSVAARLSALPPGSPWRKYTSADHQLVVHRWSAGRTRRIDPMREHRLLWAGDWLDVEDLWKAALAIGNGRILCWSYPIGAWTAEAIAKRDLRKRLRAIRGERDDARAGNVALRDTITVKNRRIDNLEVIVQERDSRIEEVEAELAQCQEDEPPTTDQLDNAKAAGREQALVWSRDIIDARRSQPWT